MKIYIAPKATNGHVIVYLINRNNANILTVKENYGGSIDLVPGETYNLEWHTWSSEDATYTIDAKLEEANTGFPDFHFERSYTGPNTDMGGFPFTLA